MWRASKAREKANNAVSAAYKKAADFIRKRKNAKPACHSFLPGTKVLTKDGKTKPIEDVAPGDKLIVTDPKTGKTVIRDVAGTIVTEDDKHFVDLTITTADGAEPTSLVSTTTHPFWSPSESAWVEAGDLQPGMTLQTADGDQVTLTATRYFEKRQRTHDLTLTEIHTYYVLAGATPVLVHNCGEGTATVYLDPVEKHATVKVETADEALHTEQVGVPGTDAVPAIRTEPHAPTTIRVRIPLPNPGGALAFQEVTLGRNLGRYNVDSRSCVTYCAEVLRAGGVTDLPDMSSSIELTKYLIRRHNAG
ncbi:polymorphic toxin-type HINT domain-containing protein [Streptomyces sp. NPDC019793]|uniref:polymorphic toxin-type HINT domain-containing protein n=1 Tax=unclassified Streptomyces TaxID=2593676 RepID=UPI000FAA85BB